jgi:hypothetical protein
MEWSTGNSYQAEALTNVLRYHACRLSHPEDKCPVGSNKTVYLCFHPLPVPMAARITKYLNKYVRRGICLIYMSSFYFWILTYPTMVFSFWLAPQVLWNDLRGIVIKQRHWQTVWGIIHVEQAFWRTGSCLLLCFSRIAWHTCIIPQNVCTPWFFTSDLLHRSYGMIYGE